MEVEVKGKSDTDDESCTVFMEKKRSFPVPNSRFYDEVGLFLISSERFIAEAQSTQRSGSILHQELQQFHNQSKVYEVTAAFNSCTCLKSFNFMYEIALCF